MHRVFSLKIGWTLAILAFIDMICVGLGMGVPIFCILFGLPVGWCLAKRAMVNTSNTRRILSQVLLNAMLTAAFTFVGMVVLWGRCVAMLFDPTADLANFGIPMILYEPVASFIGWLVLMIAISPFLQFLMSLFGAYLTVLWRSEE